jgi:hypothetical protein
LRNVVTNADRYICFSVFERLYSLLKERIPLSSSPIEVRENARGWDGHLLVLLDADYREEILDAMSDVISAPYKDVPEQWEFELLSHRPEKPVLAVPSPLRQYCWRIRLTCGSSASTAMC